MARVKVAVIKTQPETVIDDIDRLADRAGLKQALPVDKTTILKDNISWHLPFLSANTTPWQLEGVIRALRKRNYKDVVCVENRTVVTNAYKGERLNRYSHVLADYNIPVKYNFKPGDMKWIKYEPKAEMLALHKIFPRGIHIPDYFFEKNIIHLPTMKCHIYTTMTGAMKNAFGGLLNRKRHYTHSVIHETLVDLLAIQQEIHSGIFAVTDGTVAGDGAGPRTMMPVVKDYMLASADSVAIDAVSAQM
ncbi:MAG: iron-sulfur cluster-binding protein, partial [Phycisphaerae bacterium SM23_30]